MSLGLQCLGRLSPLGVSSLGRHLVAGHHRDGALQGFPAVRPVRADGGDHSDLPGGSPVFYHVRTLRPHALARVSQLGGDGAEEGAGGAAVAVAAAEPSLFESVLGRAVPRDSARVRGAHSRSGERGCCGERRAEPAGSPEMEVFVCLCETENRKQRTKRRRRRESVRRRTGTQTERPTRRTRRGARRGARRRARTGWAADASAGRATSPGAA